MLFFESMLGEGPDPKREGAFVRFAARVGSLFDVEIGGTVRREARFAEVTVIPPQAAVPLQLQAKLANEGNVALKCDNSFHIWGAQDLVVGRGALTKSYTSPGQTVTMTGEWDGALSPGAYTVVTTADCGDELVLVEESGLTIP